MAIFIYLLIGSIFGLISGSLAAGKNRSFGGWFAIGLVFGLLGIILAVVLPANPAEEVPM